MGHFPLLIEQRSEATDASDLQDVRVLFRAKFQCLAFSRFEKARLEKLNGSEHRGRRRSEEQRLPQTKTHRERATQGDNVRI
jgi:hypothetical protein